MKIRTVIFGATGMVGEGVLLEALKHKDVESVLIIVRKPSGVIHSKVTEIVHDDFFNYSTLEDQLKGYNACFFCLGTTSIGKKEKEYTRTTYDLTMGAAKVLASLNPGMIFCYVSGLGTDSSEKGSSRWARVKGKTENDLMKIPFKAVYNFRPGFIKPIKGQKKAFMIARALGLFYPVLNLFFSKYICTMEELSRAMIYVSTNVFSKHVLENKDISQLGKADKN